MCIHRPGGFLEQYGVVPHLAYMREDGCLTGAPTRPGALHPMSQWYGFDVQNEWRLVCDDFLCGVKSSSQRRTVVFEAGVSLRSPSQEDVLSNEKGREGESHGLLMSVKPWKSQDGKENSGEGRYPQGREVAHRVGQQAWIRMDHLFHAWERVQSRGGLWQIAATHTPVGVHRACPGKSLW
ncbi:hypothetical protein BKA83DRAFT_4483858 [Pisolithus microcarpus]|nr:hypothetical protein BKA83DRAFT_4483858 [Pisolithus microcarpus]